MKLSDLQTGESAVIVKVKGHGAFRKRILEMGFVKGKKVTVIKNAPFKDPIEYEIMDYKISLRRSEANLVEIVTKEDAQQIQETPFFGTISDKILQETALEKRKSINIALVGNPNCGKTTLFNYVSGSKEHVGNYSGVTVESKKANFTHKGYKFNIVDLPGTYSASAYSPEELYVRKHIIEELPDIVVNVLDTSNIERNLFLTTQLIDMDVRIVGALNMFDEFEKKGDKFEYEKLGEMLGFNFVPTISSKNKGLDKLFDKIIDVYEDTNHNKRHVRINYGRTIEGAIEKLSQEFQLSGNIPNNISHRFLAIKLLERDKELYGKYLNQPINSHLKEITEKVIKDIEEEYNDTSETIITDAKYGFIAGALKETYQESSKTRVRRSELIDAFLTHKLWGFPIFLFFMWLMFQSTFTLGQYPMNWIELGVESLMNFLNGIMPDGSFKSLLVDGVISGMGGVVVFLPNILILFFFISFMEDSGYMSRAAFIMDKLMHKMGLHGKSFIPLIMGFGCNVPAIMATRTIEDKSNRLITILINPFMSCSARLPVYILFLAAFFPEHSGTLLFAIYGLGILLAIIMANIFRRFLFREKDVPFVMELPPYRMPTLKSTIKHMWNKGGQYLKKVGSIIMVASIIIWFLHNYPKDVVFSEDFEAQKTELNNQFEKEVNYNEQESDINSFTLEHSKQVNEINKRITLERQAHSYIGRIGKFIEPTIRPLGFDWKIGVSILSGVAAKEVVISTMAVIYQADADDETNSLTTNIKNAENADGSKTFTPIVIFSFLVFILIYFPCIGVIATIKRESGSWKWAIFTVVYTTGLAWLMSFAVYQIGSLIL
ncbi:ferrous iron transport protein B [Saccharicrinis aurantiacus]|uniref:ferrous iron transport protein B n=1 Tax=Saccharicrinis aurantiacus TaxID=1849719 RepID=UPI0024905458|nr:ferrous iron transport protein B [Saccharicrinis aurantiacus]